MKQSSVVCVLFLLAAAASVQAADKMPMFVDWISQQQGGAKVKTAGYEGVDSETVCLRETKLRNCRCFNTISAGDDVTACQRGYTEVPTTCCDEKDSGKSFMAEVTPVALCTFTDDLFLKGDPASAPTAINADPISYDGTTVKKLGTFTFTCDFEDESERCGSPLCGGMTITGQGDILAYDKIAFAGESALDQLPTDTSCEADVFNSVGAPPGTQRKTKAKAEMAKPQYTYDEDHPKVFYTGPGNIYAGTFSVTSRSRPTKFKGGQIQLAFPTWTDAPDPEDYVRQRAYVAKNSRISLEFIKHADSY